jgi:membrane fusion protein (multidrug efflux system)
MQGVFRVFSVDDSNKVHVKIIQVGRSYKEAYIVKEGLLAGEKIAFGGTSLVKNESIIHPKISEWKPDHKAQTTDTN